MVPKDSPLKSVADLKGKRVALNKGSNVHYLLVKLLEKNHLKYADITPVFLPPADARAAFEKGAVDAWAIWDPFLAAAEAPDRRAPARRRHRRRQQTSTTTSRRPTSRRPTRSVISRAVRQHPGGREASCRPTCTRAAARDRAAAGPGRRRGGGQPEPLSLRRGAADAGRGRRTAEDRRRVLRAQADPQARANRRRAAGGNAAAATVAGK